MEAESLDKDKIIFQSSLVILPIKIAVSKLFAFSFLYYWARIKVIVK